MCIMLLSRADFFRKNHGHKLLQQRIKFKLKIYDIYLRAAAILNFTNELQRSDSTK